MPCSEAAETVVELADEVSQGHSLAVMLRGGMLSAQADTDTWVRNSRSGPTLNTASHYCSETVGPNLNGMATPRSYKRCMAGLGWRYVRTTIDYRYHSHSWYNS
jgi:hypothetical protein